ncbi:glycosyltransferase family 2 protein [Lactococcus lactis]|uniref:glycosyltransferase family 2 protein n=1 Tax=Lactococcus lactis TaxID=1358 RepID=UPI00068CD4B6|nr:glycosyltransferase [Lactococcus lactis]WBM77560.1 glycosyltransferase [Lactococcus lactis]WSP32023.1 glycosyltransferase [Lactococcus lactis subsp. lactis]
MTRKKLSIIVPVYNSEQYLEDCINSIILELHSFIEVLLINDGSTDNSGDICQNYSERFENIHYFFKYNTGVSDTRNFGLNFAQGDYVLFVDSDDLLLPKWSEVVSTLLKTNNDFIIIESGLKNNYSKKELFDEIFHINREIEYCSTPWSKLYKKELLEENNIIFEKAVFHGEDALFNAKVVKYASAISFSTDSIYLYRQNQTSITKSFNSNIFESDRNFLELLKCNYDEIYYKYCLENAIMMFMDKISTIGFFEGINYYHNFTKEPYYTYIHLNTDYFYKKHKLIFKLLKFKMTALAIILFKFKNKLSKKIDGSLIRI